LIFLIFLSCPFLLFFPYKSCYFHRFYLILPNFWPIALKTSSRRFYSKDFKSHEFRSTYLTALQSSVNVEFFPNYPVNKNQLLTCQHLELPHKHVPKSYVTADP
jgi:hypothetical protein